MVDDNQSPLSMDEAVRAYTQGTGQRNPAQQDNPSDDEDDSVQEAPDDEEDELAEGLAEEDEDTPEGDEAEGPDEPEDSQDYDKGRFAADNAKVKLDDGRTITVAELKKGTLLQSDYSRKTQMLAEERKTVEQTKAQFAAVENALAQERETIAMIVQAYLPKPPDPAMMDPKSGQFDFVGYVAQKDAYERNSHMIQQMIGQHREMLQRQAMEAEQSRRQLRDQEAERLFEAMPDLRKPDAYNAFWAEAVQYAAERGFSPEELDDVDDHRTYMVLRDAMAYRRLKAKVATTKGKLNGKPTLLQGSTRRSPDVVRRQEENNAMARLKKSGSLQDGIQALLAREKVR